MNDRSRSGLLVLRNNNGPQEALLTGCPSKLNKVFTVLDPQRLSLLPLCVSEIPLRLHSFSEFSTHSLLLSLRRCRASITHTAIRMRVSGSRIKLWCPLISLALIQFFTPVSAQGNCCLHGSELVFALVYWLLCGCLKYDMLS